MNKLPRHLKYAFLEPEKAKQAIVSAALTEHEEQNFGDLKKIQGSNCMVYRRFEMNQSFYLDAQDPFGRQCKDLYRTSKKAESINERSCQKKSTEMAECKLHICNLKQPLGEPSSCGS